MPAAAIDSETIKVAIIPVVAGVIGYATNWLAVKMMFRPLAFVGFRVPMLDTVARILPKTLTSFPGIPEGKVGWQGIIPAKAAKMGSIAVDKGIAKLGNVSEFYRQLEPHTIAQHVVEETGEDLRPLIDQIVSREHPAMWRDMPPRLREEVYRRVEAAYPDLIDEITEDIGAHIDQLMDVKLMVVDQMRANPEIANRVFLEVGEKEFRFIVRSGFWFGGLLGLGLMGLWLVLPQWWTLPIGGLIVGYVTNWLALTVIFSPVEPRRLGPVRIQGLFLRRQDEVADTYSGIISEDILTMERMVTQMMRGPKSDRTRALIAGHLSEAVDNAVGAATPALRVAMGRGRAERIKHSFTQEGLEQTSGALGDPEFSRRRGTLLRKLLSRRMREMPGPDFAEMLRSAFEEDEWQLIAVGAMLGGAAGVAQIVLVFGGA